METIPARVTGRLIVEMDELIKEGWYANRSELIRDAIRQMVKRVKIQMLEQFMKEDVEWGLHGKN